MRQEQILTVERRASQRSENGSDTVLYGVRWRPVPVRIRNISRGGALIVSAGKIQVGEQITICLPGIGSRTATVARGNRWLGYGLRFDRVLSAGEEAVIGSNNASRWVPIGQRVPSLEAATADDVFV